MELIVRQESVDGAVLLRVAGEIDSSNVGEFAERLATAIPQDCDDPSRPLVVDLQDVTFFGSAGLNAVLACHEKGTANGATVRLVATKPEVLDPIRVTKLDSVLALYPTVSEAIVGTTSAKT
jgi:anti-anti-sigma factor